MKYYLAIDIGATSGRHILGHFDNNELKIEEIYRFDTPLVQDGNGHAYWDVDKLFAYVKEGMKKAKELNKIPSRIGIDTFGVDYALLDENNSRIGNITSYRDIRTRQAKKELLTPEKEFELTGIQPNEFNSCYQLYCDYKSGKLEKAKTIIFLPSYLGYLLTGTLQNELSILSTGALLTPGGKSYSKEMLDNLGLKESQFPPIVEAGTSLGKLLPEIEKEVGYQSEVIASLEHDTAAAFFGSGAKKGDILLSSGTWSLLGILLDEPIATKEAYEASFTNELSFPNEVRFLKNIIGMWIINNLVRELKLDSVLGAVKEASKEESRQYKFTFDASDSSLLNPLSMKDAIYDLLRKDGHELPSSIGELFYCAYHSLAKAYDTAIKGIEKITNKKASSIYIFGGGVKAEVLNKLTEEVTGLKVNRGPSEATAIGTLLVISK